MKLTVVQFCPEFGNKEKNSQKLLNLSGSIDSDIIVFPELCTTGYFFSSRAETLHFAEEFKGILYGYIQEIAEKQNKTIVYGFAEKDGSKLFNSAAIVMPDAKQSRVYRKIHLFYRERFCFDEGDSGYFVINDEQRDVRLGTMICYDWRFPEAARTLGLMGSDIIVCPSNLVTPVWPVVMPARAIENKVYLAVANRFGSESSNQETVEFNGMSGIWSYNGDLLAQAERDGESILTYEIDPGKTRNKSFNEFNDIFNDRRPEYYLIK